MNLSIDQITSILFHIASQPLVGPAGFPHSTACWERRGRVQDFWRPRFEVIWHHLHQGSAKGAESLRVLWDKAFTIGIRPHTIMGGAEEVKVWRKSWRTREGATTVQSLGEVKCIQHQSGTTQGELVESSVQSQCLRVASTSVGLQPSASWWAWATVGQQSRPTKRRTGYRERQARTSWNPPGTSASAASSEYDDLPRVMAAVSPLSSNQLPLWPTPTVVRTGRAVPDSPSRLSTSHQNQCTYGENWAKDLKSELSSPLWEVCSLGMVGGGLDPAGRLVLSSSKEENLTKTVWGLWSQPLNLPAVWVWTSCSSLNFSTFKTWDTNPSFTEL